MIENYVLRGVPLYPWQAFNIDRSDDGLTDGKSVT
jgi:hypothetical protein